MDNNTQNWSGPSWKNADMTYQLAKMEFPAIALSSENVCMIIAIPASGDFAAL